MILKTDSRGRVRTPPQRREELLREFERRKVTTHSRPCQQPLFVKINTRPSSSSARPISRLAVLPSERASARVVFAPLRPSGFRPAPLPERFVMPLSRHGIVCAPLRPSLLRLPPSADVSSCRYRGMGLSALRYDHPCCVCLLRQTFRVALSRHGIVCAPLRPSLLRLPPSADVSSCRYRGMGFTTIPPCPPQPSLDSFGA